MKNKTNVPSVSDEYASVVGPYKHKPDLLSRRAIARLEAAAEAVHAQANGGRGFQAVSSKEGFSATVRHGSTLIEIQNDSFAIRQID